MCRVTEEESVQPDCCLDLIGYNFIESHVTTMIPGHKKAGSQERLIQGHLIQDCEFEKVEEDYFMAPCIY